MFSGVLTFKLEIFPSLYFYRILSNCFSSCHCIVIIILPHPFTKSILRSSFRKKRCSAPDADSDTSQVSFDFYSKNLLSISEWRLRPKTCLLRSPTPKEPFPITLPSFL